MKYIYYKATRNSREAVAFDIMRGELYVTTCVVDVDLLICGIKTFPCGNGDDVTLTPQQRLEILELVQSERKAIVSREKVKTLAGWRDSCLNFDEYIFLGDKVAQDIVDEMVNSVPPVTMCLTCTQSGEPFSAEPGDDGEMRDTYPTFHRVEGFLWQGERFWIFDGYCFRDENKSRYDHPGRLEQAILKAKEEGYSMKKVINPCVCKVGERNANAFAKIEYENGRLSICGVVGPLKSGNCLGSAGQCVDAIRDGKPAKGWSREMLSKFCDIWERWHLNDMRPECEHQRELGWPDMAKESVTLYHYVLTEEANGKKKEAENAARAALRKGEIFTPTAEQTLYANLAYFLDVYEPLDGKEIAQYYEPQKPDVMNGFTEQKTRGWVRAEESELGLLCKPCPVCGYKYGTSWLREEVPQDVLDWLFALPDTERQPAWV